MPDVFLSYSREDQVTARRFADALQREGFSVWWDQALNAGEAFDRVTEKALEQAQAVVVLWSKKSVESDWVRAEATQARANHRLVPVTIEPCKRPIMFELTHTADLSAWNGDSNDPAWRSFVKGLRQLVEKGSPPVALSTSPTHGTPSTSAATPAPATRRTALAFAVAALIAIGAGLYWHFQLRESKTSTTAASSPATKTPATLASIAVLPFRDMSQNKDQEYFADGVTEEILNTLAGLKDLKVSARTSAFSFKGKDVDLRTVGETLGVQHILEGSVRKDGETLRITAQLIDTKSDAHVWSKTYDRPLKDIFKVQEEIARSVAEALQVALGVGFGSQPGMTRDVEAYDAYLAASNLSLQQNAESQRRAIGQLERATAQDPKFGEAWIDLANAYSSMTGLVAEGRQAWSQKADAALENARRVAPDSPWLHAVLAERSINQSHWTEAAGHYQDMDAQLAKLGQQNCLCKGRFFLMVGRAREAMALLAEEKARDPLNPAASFFLGVAYSSVRDFPAASAEFERGYMLDASWQFLFRLVSLSNALSAGDRVEIRRLVVQIANTPGTRPENGTQLIPLLDRPSDALIHLRKQVRDPTASPGGLGGTAQYLAYFGDPQAALAAHRLAFERGGANTASFSTWYPVFREVRRLPEFKQLVRDMSYVDYWRTYGWGDFCKPTTGDDFECT